MECTGDKKFIRYTKNNYNLPDYAGLNSEGFIILMVPFFIVGPLWLIIAWAIWLFKPFKSGAVVNYVNTSR